jgi:integrase/recombinase XerD
MSHQSLTQSRWLSRLNDYLITEGYARATASHHIRTARGFLVFLENEGFELSSVQPTHAENYLQQALRRFRCRRGHAAHRRWRSAQTAPLQNLLSLVRVQWPSTPKVMSSVKKFQPQICDHYARWMVEVRGLAAKTVACRCKDASHFLSWLRKGFRKRIASLTTAEIDGYLKERFLAVGRSGMPMVADSLRAFLRWLYATGRTRRDLSTLVIRPSRYAFETVPSALRSEDVEKVLDLVRREDTAKGIHDYAILMLLSTYGVRAGELVALQLDDIDWRKQVIRIHHTKTGCTSYLPLMPKVGKAILKYLQKVRPKTALREVFVGHRPRYRALKATNLFQLTRERLQAVGVVSGKRGPHAFRHTRAVSLLRGGVPLKEIGDMLGHRSLASTMTYLKLATEDLRAVALDIPVEVKA